MIIKSEYDEAKYNQGLDDALNGKGPVMPDDESYMKGYNESSKINNYPDKGIDVKASRKIQPSHQITSAKSSWKQFIKGLDKLEKRDELKDMYNQAHWEFLDYIMPCDLEWTEDMNDSDFNPLDEIYFLFKSPSDIEEFLFECAKENLPGAKEKLQRIRQINTCNQVYSSRQIKSSLGPRNEKKAKELIDEYNSLSVGDSLYTSTHLGRYLDFYFREHGLSYGDDFMCPPYREGEIVKLTDKKVTSSRKPIKSAKSQEEFENLVIDIENRLGVNVEHSNVFNLPVELTFEDECYIDDICREQNCRFVPVNGSRRQYRLIQSSRRNNMIKSAYTRSDSERFDEYGYFNPYTPTEEELAKKDEIKKVLKQELSDAYEPDPMDDYAGYDSTNERIDMACERVAKQFGVDTDFVDQIAGEIENEENARLYEEAEWAEKNLKGDEYDKWYRGELDIRDRIHSSRQIKSSIITPWDINQVTGTSDEDLGLSAVVDIYGNEFVNVDESTLNELKDTLVRYFDDEAYVRDWNINNPDYQIEDAFEVTDPEEMDVEDLARYFDYEAYGRDIRLEDNMVWDSENQYWVSAHDVDDEELNNNKYIF